MLFFCMALSLARQRVLWKRELSYGLIHLPISGPKSVPGHTVDTGYLLRECLCLNPVKCCIHWKIKICTLCWGLKSRQKLMVRSLFGTHVANPRLNHLSDKEQFLWGQQYLGANPSPVRFHLHGFRRVMGCVRASVSSPVERGCESLHQSIAVKNLIKWWV